MENPPPAERVHRPTARELWLRPLYVLACLIIGFFAFRALVINGTVIDGQTKPSWMDKRDLYDAQDAMESANFAKAEEIARELIEKEPNYGAAHRLLGYLMLQRDELDRALHHYQIASQYHPDDGTIARAIDMIKQRQAHAK